MSFRPLIRQRAVVPAAVAALAAGVTFYPRRVLYAEVPSEEEIHKRPIYDDLPDNTSAPPKSRPIGSHYSSNPTPTDRLAVEVRRVRLFLYDQSIAAENKINSAMSSFMDMENSFTNTIASLAPPKESGEKLMPGAIYILVAAMAGSIVTRNRNIFLRASVPVAVGVGAGWAALPITMRNIGDLAWEYEKRVPVISENHMRIRGAAEEGWRQAKVRSIAAGRFVDEKVSEGRAVVEDLVKKGR
ncbi:MAG: hypothetical protein M1834_006089 [Cirrosporium novae-zelandiae]|nr:MAG: hypothetical protein M1834_006089 [Cirrosporium novae-zelandiae]